MSVSCYLCVERPPPGDLRSHLLYHHLIENDEALPSIIGLSRKKSIETQTTVTWVSEFEYYDNRKRHNSESNGLIDLQEIKKSKNGNCQRQKIIQSSKRNRRYPNNTPHILFAKRQKLAEKTPSSDEHIQKKIKECFTGSEEDQISISHEEFPGISEKTTSKLKIRTIENKEKENNTTEVTPMNHSDNNPQSKNTRLLQDSTQESGMETKIHSTQNRDINVGCEEKIESEDESWHNENETERGIDNDMDITVDSDSFIDKPEEFPDKTQTEIVHDLIKDTNNQNMQTPIENEKDRSEIPRVEEEFDGQPSILKNLMSQGSLSIIKPSGKDESQISVLIENKQENFICETEDKSLKINNLGNSISITRIPSNVDNAAENAAETNDKPSNKTCPDFDIAFYSDEESEEENE